MWTNVQNKKWKVKIYKTMSFMLHCISCSFWCKDVLAIFVSVRKRDSWRRAVIENRRLRLVSDQIYDVLEWYVYENLLDIMFVRLRTSCMFGLEGKWCQQAEQEVGSWTNPTVWSQEAGGLIYRRRPVKTSSLCKLYSHLCSRPKVISRKLFFWWRKPWNRSWRTFHTES